MRSRINIIIILVSIILLIFLTYRGGKIGNIEILSISALVQKNNFLAQKIEEASILTSQKYPENISKTEDTFEKYLTQKQKYEQLVKVTNKDEQIYQTKQYDISYLWRVLGAYAKQKKYDEDAGVTLGLDVKKSATGANLYDLNFTVTGKYTRIIEFILDIENNSDLRFRIYDFKMTGKTNDNSEATFTVRNVNIDSSTIARTANK